MHAKLPDALANALGRVVADAQKEWRKEADRFNAECRATIAELRAEVLGLKAELKATTDGELKRISEVAATVKDGSPGKDGEPGEPGAPGEPGKDADVDEVAAKVRESISDELTALRSIVESIPEAPELPDIPAMVNEAVAAIPPPQDGKSVTVEDVRPLIEETVSAAVSALPAPKDGEPGKDADMDAIAEMIGEKVQEAIAGVELPRDGKDGRDGIDGKDGVDGINGKDGLDAVSFMVDRAGHLIGSMSDGSTRDLGEIIGRDGAAGRDGFGFDDMNAEYDGERTVTLVFTKGEHVQRFPIMLPVVIDRGVYKEGKTYTAGDAVSYGGSMWIAQEETGEKPDGGKGWRLAVKRGRDGKDGTLKPPADPKPLKVG